MTSSAADSASRFRRLGRRAPWIAGACWLLALAICGLPLSGYTPLQHPQALLGAQSGLRSDAFNVFGFVLPGLLMAMAGFCLRDMTAAHGWRARIACQLLLLSGIAFAAQGLLPLDASDLDAPESRMHAAAWSLWWIAALSGAALLASALRRVAVVLAVTLPLLALCALAGFPALSQYLAVAGWFALGHAASRAPQP